MLIYSVSYCMTCNLLVQVLCNAMKKNSINVFYFQSISEKLGFLKNSKMALNFQNSLTKRCLLWLLPGIWQCQVAKPAISGSHLQKNIGETQKRCLPSFFSSSRDIFRYIIVTFISNVFISSTKITDIEFELFINFNSSS